nr:GIDE domain-containing protein [Kofleriaceae bacterium]
MGTIRTLRKATLYAIADLPEGQRGRVVGAAIAIGPPLRAPLSGRPCVYYSAQVDYFDSHENLFEPVVVAKELRGGPFALADGSGRAIVDPTGAELELVIELCNASPTFDAKASVERGFFERHGHPHYDWLLDKRARYHEAIIEVGERVAVLGEGVREPDPDAPPPDDYRGDLPTRLRIAASPESPLLISDFRDVTQPK